MIESFHFIRPEWFWAFIPLFLIIAMLYMHKQRSGNWSNIIDPKLLDHVLTIKQSRNLLWPLVLISLAGTLCITALAGPAWQKIPLPVFAKQSALVILLDLSRSMDSQDLKPSRLQRARHKITDILQQRKEGQTALVVYAAQAFTVTPLTDDTETIESQLSTLTTDLMPRQGSRADLAIEKALELFEQATITNGEILLITDGVDANKIDSGIKRLRNQGHDIAILGTGTPAGAPIPLRSGGFLKDNNGSIVIPKLDAESLQRYGRYHTLTFDDRDISHLFNIGAIDDINLAAEKTEHETDTWQDAGYWLIIPLLIICLLAFRRGLLIIAFFILLPITEPASASVWDKLWLNKNQQGAKALTKGNAQQAVELLSEAEWLAAAQYKNQQYDAAIKTLEGIEKPDALYNKGNALAQLGKIENAIAAYQKALELDPEHEDAQYNLEQLLKQQSNQNKQQDNSQDSKQSQQENTEPDQNNSQASNDSNEKNPSDPDTSQEMEKESAEQNQQLSENKNDNKQDKADESNNKNQSEIAKNDSEQQKINQQWLRRIPDDPGGLLRRKFFYQYRNQSENTEENEPW